MKRLITVLVLAALPVVAAADETPLLTLDAALVRAFEANHGVERARAEVAISEADVDAAFSFVKPRVELSAQATRNEPDASFSFGEGGPRITVLPKNDWDASLRLVQPIYAGLREWKAYRQAQAVVRGNLDGLEATEEALALKVVARYFDVLRGDALIDVETKSVEIARGRLDEATAFFDAGEVTRVDVLRASAAIKGAERRLAEARRLRESAASALRVLLDLEGDFAVTRPPLLVAPLPAEADLVERAWSKRPELARALVAEEIAGLEIGKQKGARLPTVEAEAALVRQRANFPSDEFAFLTLRVKVPVFQGGRVGARVAAAEEKERQARLGVAELCLALREEVRRALLDLETAETDLGLAREQLAAVEAENEQVKDLYHALEATSLDRDAAELSLAAARRAVANASLDRDLAAARAWYAAGDLRSALFAEDIP